MSRVKLTRPQEDLLREAAKRPTTGAYSSYPPAKKLVELGYVEWRPQRFGGQVLVITDAGRAALQEAGHER